MKASAGGYARATDLDHALRLLQLAEGSGRVLAGGQSLVPALNMRLSADDLLVDISRLEALRGVEAQEGALRIGALTRHAEIAENALIAAHAPLLAEAAGLVAHAAIRNRGTLGGAAANADPAAEFPACLLALDAVLEVAGPEGRREIAAGEFFLDVFETALEEGEILTAIRVPVAEPDERQAIVEMARRAGDYALAGLCVIRRAAGYRVSAFSLGPRPILARRAMAALDAGDLDAACAALRAEIDPASDTQASAAYRRHLAGVLLRRAATRISEGEE